MKDHRQIYLIGNPLMWYLSTLSVAAYILVRGFLILRARKAFKDIGSTVRLAYLPFTPLSNVSSSQSREMRLNLRFPLH